MKEQQNLALIDSVYDAFRRGDVNFILNLLTEDVDWVMEGPSIIPFAGKRKGIAQVKKFFEALTTTQTNQKLTLETTIAQGDKVASVGRYAAKVSATGRSFDSPIAHFFTIRDGKISGFIDVAETSAMESAYGAALSAAS